jgi:hypothetical protein
MSLLAKTAKFPFKVALAIIKFPFKVIIRIIKIPYEILKQIRLVFFWD